MSRTLLLSLLAAMTVLSTARAGSAPQPNAAQPVPRIVVEILVDRLRSDYLEAFMPLYGDAGFRRLLAEGRVYSSVDYPMVLPDEASAAATLSTGAAPAAHGIIARRWLDRETLQPVFCISDAAFPATGSARGGASPRFLGVSTLGDELKAASEGKALVYAIAPNAESAVLHAGHAADGATWIDNETGKWTSSSYYGGLPAFAAVRNQMGVLAGELTKVCWQPSSDLVGNFSYFLGGGMRTPFRHDFKGVARFADFKTSGLVNAEVAAAATSCIEGTMMGSDGITDFLAVTFYAGTYQHAATSQAGMELQDTYVRLDAALAQLIAAVEKKVGRDEALFVLTSTGCADEGEAPDARYRIPGGKLDIARTAQLLNMYLVAVYGPGQYVEETFGTQLYLNHKLIEQKSLNPAEVQERAQSLLVQISGVKDVYTEQRLLLGAWTPGISRIRAGYNPRYSGDILLQPAPGWRYTNDKTNESRIARESFLPFPIIFYGYALPAERIAIPTTVDCIAPTLAKTIRIRAPNACAAAPLF